MKLATSYFYQIRHFKQWYIPISTALSDPDWYRPREGQEYFLDNRGIVCGLRYEPLIVQQEGTHTCFGPESCWYANADIRDPYGKEIPCPTMIEYEQLLHSLVNKERTLQAFEYCAAKFKKELDLPCEPVIVLMVYETPDNRCSERAALQRFFNCKELRYPIC